VLVEVVREGDGSEGVEGREWMMEGKKGERSSGG